MTATRISGAIVFTGEQSQRGYRLNRMAMSLTDAGQRARFVADEAAYMRAMDLDDAEIDLVGGATGAACWNMAAASI